jgi:hypothetical protein
MKPEPFRPATHFRDELRQLQRAGQASWQAVARLSDGDLRDLAADGLCSEGRLRHLRGQARLIVEVGLTAPEAALLLRAGIPSPTALAEARPEQLLGQLGRFQRQWLGRAAAALELSTVRRWIRMAGGAAGRSPK